MKNDLYDKLSIIVLERLPHLPKKCTALRDLLTFLF